MTISGSANWYNVKSYGAVGDGVTDDTAACQAAVAAACASTYGRVVYWPAGSYKLTMPVAGVMFQLSAPGVQFIGDGGWRAGITPDAGGTKLLIYGGAGIVVQNGTDNGLALDGSYYDGFEGVRMERFQATYSGTTVTALTNGFGNYGTSVTFFKDWRGGGERWNDVCINNFRYGFQGIQSDINSFRDVMFRQNKVGMYLGPRSDQNDIFGIYGLHNDNLFTGDANDTKFWGGVSNSDGSSATCAFDFPGAYSGTTKNIHWYSFWFENSTGQAATAIDSFVRVGVGATNQVTDFYFHTPVIINSASPSTPRTKYLVNIGNADGVYVEGVAGQPLDAIMEFSGSTSPTSLIIRQDRRTIPTPR
jgi:hypothetical protein